MVSNYSSSFFSLAPRECLSGGKEPYPELDNLNAASAVMYKGNFISQGLDSKFVDGILFAGLYLVPPEHTPTKLAQMLIQCKSFPSFFILNNFPSPKVGPHSLKIVPHLKKSFAFWMKLKKRSSPILFPKNNVFLSRQVLKRPNIFSCCSHTIFIITTEAIWIGGSQIS